MIKSYQRRHLRAPFKESVLYADQGHVFKASTMNISEGGLLIDQLPSFPADDIVPILISVPIVPHLKNFTLLKMQTFTKEIFQRNIIRIRAKLVRREQLAQNLDNIFRSRFGLMFNKIDHRDQKLIDDYVMVYASNLIYLQTLIDSFNTDEESRNRTRVMANIMGYMENEKISHLRAAVSEDYKGLQWL